MARSRFASPATTRLSLSDGDWLEVKTRLTAGERNELLGKRFGRVLADGSREVRWADLPFAATAMWLVDWSFRDEQGKPVAVSESALKNLHEDDFAEVQQAVDAHADAMAAEVAEAKKTRGETASAAISPSVA